MLYRHKDYQESYVHICDDAHKYQKKYIRERPRIVVHDISAYMLKDEKPDAETRSILKSNGFRFAPSQNNAWQRHLNNNGRYALKRVIEILGA